MEKLYKYLNKIGVEEKPRRGNYTPAPAEFYRQTYGEQGYFENAPGYTYPGAVVTLDYNAEAPAEYFKSLQKIETRIERYCKKYGFSCRRDTCHYSKSVYFYIEKQTDRENAANYYRFRDACREECDKIAHYLYSIGRPEAVNNELKIVINKYGESYKEFLQATQTATA